MPAVEDTARRCHTLHPRHLKDRRQRRRRQLAEAKLTFEALGATLPAMGTPTHPAYRVFADLAALRRP